MKHLEESFYKFQNAETANMNLFFHQANFWFILTESLKRNLCFFRKNDSTHHLSNREELFFNYKKPY